MTDNEWAKAPGFYDDHVFSATLVARFADPVPEDELPMVVSDFHVTANGRELGFCFCGQEIWREDGDAEDMGRYELCDCERVYERTRDAAGHRAGEEDYPEVSIGDFRAITFVEPPEFEDETDDEPPFPVEVVECVFSVEGDEESDSAEYRVTDGRWG